MGGFKGKNYRVSVKLLKFNTNDDQNNDSQDKYLNLRISWLKVRQSLIP